MPTKKLRKPKFRKPKLRKTKHKLKKYVGGYNTIGGMNSLFIYIKPQTNIKILINTEIEILVDKQTKLLNAYDELNKSDPFLEPEKEEKRKKDLTDIWRKMEEIAYKINRLLQLNMK